MRIYLFIALAIFPLSAWSSTPRAAFGLNELQTAIENSGASTIEEVAPILASHLGSDVTAMYSSDSAQSGTPESPRIIYWDPDAGFAATFNGGAPGDIEGNAIEMFQFHFGESTFDFLRQEFPLPKDSTGKVHFVPTAEASCLKCHGQDPRPIWGEYPLWEGAFGSHDDLIIGNETTLFADFFQKSQSELRFQALFSHEDPPYPYRDYSKAMQKTRNAAAFRPNERLGYLVSRLNQARVMRKIREGPHYKENIAALLYGFLGCNENGIQQTLPALAALAGVSLLDLDIKATYQADATTVTAYAAGPSYFDGSASMNELLANEIFKDAVKADKRYADYYDPRTLFKKYYPGPTVNNIDIEFNQKMDKLGQWIPTPYDPEETKTKNRERFAPFEESWKAACGFVSRETSLAILPTLSEKLPAAPKTPLAVVGHGPFTMFQKYCSRCHGDSGILPLGVKTDDDLFSLGETVTDLIDSGKMPRGQNDWTPDLKQEWERDRPTFLSELRTHTKVAR